MLAVGGKPQFLSHRLSEGPHLIQLVSPRESDLGDPAGSCSVIYDLALGLTHCDIYTVPSWPPTSALVLCGRGLHEGMHASWWGSVGPFWGLATVI